MKRMQMCFATIVVFALTSSVARAQPAVGATWHSWQTTILTGEEATESGDFLNRGIITGSDRTPAFLQMYVTAGEYFDDDFDVRQPRASSDASLFVDDDGNGPASAVTGIYRTNSVGHENLMGDGTGTAYSHSDAGPGSNQFDSSSWWAIPAKNSGPVTNRHYMGLAGPRPTDGTHGELPGGVDGAEDDIGVMDLAFHTSNDNRLNVFAFVAPDDGVYQVTDLALRRAVDAPSNSRNRSSSLQVFDSDGRPVGRHFYVGAPHPDTGLPSTGDHRHWAYQSETFELALDEGDKIYFGAHRSVFTSEHAHWDLGNTELAFTITYVDDVLGDAHDDGQVDRLDVLKLLKHYAREDASRLQADLNDDRHVDLTDAANMQQIIGDAGSPVTAAAVPEPSGLVLLAVGGMMLMCYRGSRMLER